MKAICILAVAVFIMITANAQSFQWSEELISGNVVNSVYFSGSDNGYAVGGCIGPDGVSRGIILRTHDGGMSWEKLGTNFYLHSVCFMNETRGYAIGEYVLRTTNGGDDWQIVNHIDREYIQDFLTFPEELHGYMIGENDRVLRNPEDQGPYGIEEKQGGCFPRLYPNPANSSLTVATTGDCSGMIIRILSMNGEVLSKQSVTAPTTVIDVGTLSPGAYLIRFTGKGTDVSRKFIRQ
jgi:hypothetical protein